MIILIPKTQLMDHCLNNMKGGYDFPEYKDNVKLHTEIHFTEMIKYLYNFLLKHEPIIGKQSFLAKES